VNSGKSEHHACQSNDSLRFKRLSDTALKIHDTAQRVIKATVWEKSSPCSLKELTNQSFLAGQHPIVLRLGQQIVPLIFRKRL